MKFLVISLSLISCLQTNAAESFKPGLWEHDYKIKSKSGKYESAIINMKAQLAKMPPEQQKMMKDMMAKQDMSFSMESNRIKYCMSKEQAEKQELPKFKDENCTQEIFDRTPTSGKVKINCKDGISGTGEYKLNSPTSYSMKLILDTKLNGESDQLNIDQTGKWLSANCGNLKPAN